MLSCIFKSIDYYSSTYFKNTFEVRDFIIVLPLKHTGLVLRLTLDCRFNAHLRRRWPVRRGLVKRSNWQNRLSRQGTLRIWGTTNFTNCGRLLVFKCALSTSPSFLILRSIALIAIDQILNFLKLIGLMLFIRCKEMAHSIQQCFKLKFIFFVYLSRDFIIIYDQSRSFKMKYNRNVNQILVGSDMM